MAEPLRYVDVYTKQKLKELKLRKAGYVVTSIWEHEIMEELEKNKEMRDFFNNEKLWTFLKHPLRTAREAYYGNHRDHTIIAF